MYALMIHRIIPGGERADGYQVMSWEAAVPPMADPAEACRRAEEVLATIPRDEEVLVEAIDVDTGLPIYPWWEAKADAAVDPRLSY